MGVDVSECVYRNLWVMLASEAIQMMETSQLDKRFKFFNNRTRRRIINSKKWMENPAITQKEHS